MKFINKLWQIVLFTASAGTVFAHIGPQSSNSKNTTKETTINFREDCQPGVAETDQDINNVRARLSTGGDVWWNRQEGLYIVPKPAEGQDAVSSIFAGGVWIGGTTRAQSLKLAGVTYRSLNNNFDWYPGPLDELGGTDAPICADWDQFFEVLATEVSQHNDGWETDPANYSCDSIPPGVRYWPGKGNPYWREKYDFDLPDQPLGAFWDENQDGVYDPCDGDFPTIEIEGCNNGGRRKAKELVPDQMLFWIYNDNGGPHRLTAGDAIQMEVQVQAFAYATNDEVNDMTFQRYRLINKATEDLIDCYFAMWVDPDLGCAFDDFSGCDNSIDASGKPRSLAFTYNEDAVDGNNGPNCSGGVNTYGFEVPIVGTDYFRGPLGPKIFLRDDDGNVILNSEGNPILLNPIPGSGIADTLVELGMTSCIFTFNCGSNPPNPATCDPEGQDIQFYNNLRGLWRTGEPITRGGSGFNPGSTDTVKFMYPDIPDNPVGWSMCNTGVSNVDTRTLQATGPLLLQPGRINELIIGVVWVPDLEYPCPDISRLQSADDLAQALFDNCFDITDGPDAPDLAGIELDRELIITLTNSTSSNNFQENYEEVDLQYNGPPGGDDTYNFEGYKVYQLRDAGVSAQELGDVTKARLIIQVDKSNDIAEIYNWTSVNNPLDNDQRVWTFTRQVQGANAGIDRTFQILEDQFAPTDKRLINHKPYHFLVLAYGHNNWANFDIGTEVGQRRPYLEGRRNIKVYSLVPRPIVYQNLNAEYGDGAVITRTSGQGNNGSFLELADGQREAIVTTGLTDRRLTYREGQGPIDVKIFNPLEVKDGKYRLEFKGEFDSRSSVCALLPGAVWELTDLETGEVVASERTIDELNEQIIYKKGFSVTVSQAKEPGTGEEGNGAVGIRLDYKDGADPWLVPVTDGGNPQYVTALTQVVIEGLTAGIPPQYNPGSVIDVVDNDLTLDPDNVYGRLNGGAFFPFYSARVQTNDDLGNPVPPYLTPGARESSLLRLARSSGEIKLSQLNNVDIVFTPNKDLWSRCVVVETANPSHYDALGLNTETGTEQFDLIKKPSVDKNGQPDNSGTQGLSWFPGYAVDVETGQRLNIFFGENTIYHGDLANYLDKPGIANDMIFNPSSQLVSAEGELGEFAAVVLGGQHYVYVTRTIYDECAELAKEFSKVSIGFDRLSAITWTGVPMISASNPLKPISEGLIPSELVVKLRVNNSYSPEIEKRELSRLKRCDFVEGLPAYEFEISGRAAEDIQPAEYEGALANVNVVPNPYYAFSAYENSELVNTVKITNLPDRAIVTIYTLDGKFIRQFNRAEAPTEITDPYGSVVNLQTKPSLEWDLKNHKGIPIASGVYLIHVAAPQLGEERVLKWFGINRKFDPTGL